MFINIYHKGCRKWDKLGILEGKKPKRKTSLWVKIALKYFWFNLPVEHFSAEWENTDTTSYLKLNNYNL